jgi:hypothetical protein
MLKSPIWSFRFQNVLTSDPHSGCLIDGFFLNYPSIIREQTFNKLLLHMYVACSHCLLDRYS